MDSGSRVVPVWVKATTWSVAIGVAALGVVLSVALSSVWPLVAFLGLALPMVPVRASRSARVEVSGSEPG
ncbi:MULTISPECIES: hypothetical protein [Microbacterium]|uniref:hypothetical protein n=1 Tax=Microbacterium TaxID=33882 RepID=UPI000D65D580|nr:MULTISPECIES: hypothetical protein [Microbacterium]